MKSTMKTTTHIHRGIRLLLLLLALLLTLSACAKDGGEPAGSEGTNATPTEQPTEEPLPYRVVRYDTGDESFVFDNVDDFKQYYMENLKEVMPFYFWLDAEKLDAQLTVTLSRSNAEASWSFLRVNFTFTREDKQYSGSLVQRVYELSESNSLTDSEWNELQVGYMGSVGSYKWYDMTSPDRSYKFPGWLEIRYTSAGSFGYDEIANEIFESIIMVR